MKLSTFKKTQAEAFVVSYPEDESFVVTLLPFGHADAFNMFQTQTPIASVNKISKVFNNGSPTMEDYAREFDTLAEFQAIERRLVAAHIIDWSGLTDEDAPVVFGYETACDLLVEYDELYKWVKVLAETAAQNDETEDKIEEISKN